MKIGTISCHLFGHKFRWSYYDPEKNIGLKPGINGIETSENTKYCIRCGIDKLNQGER